MESRKNNNHKLCRQQNLKHKFSSIRQELFIYQQENKALIQFQKSQQIAETNLPKDYNTNNSYPQYNHQLENKHSNRNRKTQQIHSHSTETEQQQYLNVSKSDIERCCETVQELLKQCDDTNIKNFIQTNYLLEKIKDSYMKVFLPSYNILETLILKKEKKNSEIYTIFCIWNFLCFIKVCLRMHEFKQIQEIIKQITNLETVMPILRYIMNIGRKIKLETQQILIQLFENFQSSSVLLNEHFVNLFLIEEQFQQKSEINSLEQEENQALINLWLVILKKNAPQKFAQILNYTNIFHKCIIGYHLQFAKSLLTLTQHKLGQSHELYQAEKENLQIFIRSQVNQNKQEQYSQDDNVCRRTCQFDFGFPFS